MSADANAKSIIALIAAANGMQYSAVARIPGGRAFLKGNKHYRDLTQMNGFASLNSLRDSLKRFRN